MNNKINWSRIPSDDKVSHVFIYSDFDTPSEEDYKLLPIMLNNYTEVLSSMQQYENRKKIFFILTTLALLAGWFILAVSSNI